MRPAALFLFLILFFGKISPIFAADKARMLVVIEPVANIRKEPLPAKAAYSHDDLQETQVLYNERLILKREQGDWCYVEAVEQREFTHNNKWEGYPGWIKKESVRFVEVSPGYNSVVRSHTAQVLAAPGDKKAWMVVSLGTRFEIIDEGQGYYKVCLPDHRTGWMERQNLRRISEQPAGPQDIVNTARLFLGMPYLWGGRSAYIPRLNVMATGVDCSGLTSLACRANNINIPRDAHEQWMLSGKIAAADLRAGDLIFVSARDKHDKITHVMLSAGGEGFIEAAQTGDKVASRTFKEKFGLNMGELSGRGFVADGKKIYFGRINIKAWDGQD